MRVVTISSRIGALVAMVWLLLHVPVWADDQFQIRFELSNREQLHNLDKGLSITLVDAGSQLPERSVLRISLSHEVPALYARPPARMQSYDVESRRGSYDGEGTHLTLAVTSEEQSIHPGWYRVQVELDHRQRPDVRDVLKDANPEVYSELVFLGTRSDYAKKIVNEGQSIFLQLQEFEKAVLSFHTWYQDYFSDRPENEVASKAYHKQQEPVLRAILEYRELMHRGSVNSVLQDAHALQFAAAGSWMQSLDEAATPIRRGQPWLDPMTLDPRSLLVRMQADLLRSEWYSIVHLISDMSLDVAGMYRTLVNGKTVKRSRRAMERDWVQAANELQTAWVMIDKQYPMQRVEELSAQLDACQSKQSGIKAERDYARAVLGMIEEGQLQDGAEFVKMFTMCLNRHMGWLDGSGSESSAMQALADVQEAVRTMQSDIFNVPLPEGWLAGDDSQDDAQPPRER